MDLIRMKESEKQSRGTTVLEKNCAKYLSYREAWVRIKKAQAFRFYLEAVTLEESIMADRLLSFLVRAATIQPDSRPEKYNFGDLIRLWRKTAPEPIVTKHFPDLSVALDEWRKNRNKIVHGMVKSAPYSEHEDVLNFLEEAKLVASQGNTIARDLTDWARKMKRSQVRSLAKLPEGPGQVSEIANAASASERT
jgi:hypothetical protein